MHTIASSVYIGQPEHVATSVLEDTIATEQGDVLVGLGEWSHWAS